MAPSLLVFLKPNEKMFKVKKLSTEAEETNQLCSSTYQFGLFKSPLPNKQALLETGLTHGEAGSSIAWYSCSTSVY